MHHAYKPAKFHFTESQIHKIKKGHNKVRLAHHQIGKGPHTLLLHPMQHEKVSQAHRKGKGVDIIISPGELHHSMHSGMHGTGIWDSIKNGLSTVWRYAKPVLGAVGDAIAYSNPELAPLREGVRNITGVGLKKHKHKKAYDTDSESSESESEDGGSLRKRHHKKKRAHKKGNGLYL
jgi:hypothetical protein